MTARQDERAARQALAVEAEASLDRTMARLFSGADGQAVLGYLGSLTFGRVMDGSASDAALRHLEGQRWLVQHLMERIERGRRHPSGG